MLRYNLPTKREAVNFALAAMATQPLTPDEEALALARDLTAAGHGLDVIRRGLEALRLARTAGPPIDTELTGTIEPLYERAGGREALLAEAAAELRAN